MINYNNSFGPHQVTALAVIEARDKHCWNLGARRNNYGILVDEINSGSSDPSDISNSGTSWRERQVGYVFRAGYNYDNRYLVELYANGRRLELETNDAFWFRHDKDKGKVLQVWYNPNARCVERKSWETEFFAAVLAVIGAALLLIR